MYNLRPIDSLKVTILVDNYIDILLPSNDLVKRPPLIDGERLAKNPISEHGLSLLIEVEEESFIMDFGLTEFGLSYNMEVLGIDPKKISLGVLSHGHHDHMGGFFRFMKNRASSFSLYLHEHALKERRGLVLPSGESFYFPPLEKKRMEDAGTNLITLTEPTFILNERALISGEIPRVTDFEQGLPGAFYEEGGKRFEDKMRDDMALYFNLKDKGLVVISGCAHAGIINSVLYGKKVSGVDDIHAILGGFHLTGPGMEKILPKTLQFLKEFSPDIICPMHCTGWDSQHKIKELFGDRFLISSSGSSITFG